MESRLIGVGALLTVAGALCVGAMRAAGARPLLSGVALLPVSVGIVGAVTIVVGLVGYVVVPPLRGDARARRFGSHGAILATILVAQLAANLIPLALLLVLLPGRPMLGLATLPGFLIAAVSTDLVLLALAYLRAIRPGLVQVQGLSGTRSGAILRAGVLGGLGLFGLSALVQLALRSAGINQDQLESFLWVRALSPAAFLVMLFAGAIMAPLAEELFFRGFVFRSYARRYGPLVAAILSALLFAVLHVNVAAFLPIFVMGLFLAWLYHRTGSLVPGMIAHGFNNAVAFTVLYTVGV